jgi:multiple sugar transport system permease protein
VNTQLAVYAGYSFAKFQYTGRRLVMVFLLSVQVFPFGLRLISLYPMVTSLKLIDTRLGLAPVLHRLHSAGFDLYALQLFQPNAVGDDRSGTGRRRERVADLSDWGGVMAASLVASFPIVIAFAFLQRWFIQGVTAGSVQ